jgi:hypothetical protein
MAGAVNKNISCNASDSEKLIFSHSDNISSDAKFAVSTRKIQGGLRGGMEIIEVDNGSLKFWLLPERGMGIWKAWIGDIEIGWQSPVRGPVHPRFVPIHEESGLGWLAGFDELFCRCGLESNGAPEFDAQGKLKYPLHGKIANLPAFKVDTGFNEDEQAISVMGQVEETRFKSQKLELTASIMSRIQSKEIVIHDKVSNLSDLPGEFQLLYHINFSSPFLEKGAEIIAAVKTLVPRTPRAEEGVDQWFSFSAPEAGFQEQVYFLELRGDTGGNSQVLLKNASATKGVSIHFNILQLPCFTLWKNTDSMRNGYVAGLEPGINFPNPRSYEQAQGRVATLMPDESREFELRLEFHLDADSVATAQQKIAAYQGACKPQIHRTMRPGWTIEAD